jgi:ribonuclease T2
VEVPPRLAGLEAAEEASPEEIERAFLDANPWLKADMIAVTCRRQTLLDIRICFGRDLFPRPCGGNEDQRRLCPASKISIPPAAP